MKLIIALILAGLVWTDSKQRAAQVIDTVIHWQQEGSLFERVLMKQLGMYFTNEMPWGLNSLTTLHMYLSSAHTTAATTLSPEIDDPGRLMDELKIKLFFAALLPPDLDDIVVRVLEGFCREILHNNNVFEVDDMLETYLFIHHKQPTQLEMLQPLSLVGSKPDKAIHALIKRFHKLYPRKKLQDRFAAIAV